MASTSVLPPCPTTVTVTVDHSTGASHRHPWLPVSPCTSGCLPAAPARVRLPHQAFRWAAVLALLGSLAALLPIARLLPAAHRDAVHRRLAVAILRACGIAVHRLGADRFATDGDGALVVAHHVSWLDVLALPAVQPVRLLAKADVAHWPVVGTVARALGTRFVDRSRLSTLPATVADSAAALREGRRLAVFPEGTTWCGAARGSFRPAMFQAAVDAGVPVRPVSLRYLLPDGSPATVASFVGDESLPASMRRILALRGVRLEVTVLPLQAPGPDRRLLAERCARLLREIELPALLPDDPDPAEVSTPRRAGTTPAGRRVLLVSGSVGAGHDGAARELADRLRRAEVTVDVRDYVEALPPLAGRLLREGYSPLVERAPAAFGWVFAGIETSRVVHAVVQRFCGLARRRLQRWTLDGDYDLVVSTYPLASQVLGELRGRGTLGCPVVTYLTDPATHRTWIHGCVDVHLTVTRATAEHGRDTYGVPLQVGGPLVPDRFAAPLPPARRRALRRELTLAPDRPVVLVAAGSLGMGDPTATARDVCAAGMTPIVLCGRNHALRERAASLPGVVALGWRDDVPDLMAVSDVLVHNAGGLTFTEAMVAGLPAITYRAIPGHGLANAALLDSSGLAPWARDADHLAELLHRQAGGSRTRIAHPDPAAVITSMLAAPPRLLPQAA